MTGCAVSTIWSCTGLNGALQVRGRRAGPLTPRIGGRALIKQRREALKAAEVLAGKLAAEEREERAAAQKRLGSAAAVALNAKLEMLRAGQSAGTGKGCRNGQAGP